MQLQKNMFNKRHGQLNENKVRLLPHVPHNATID
jgi:hypothetical protein